MNSAPRRPIALVILDGWGLPDTTGSNVFARSHTPNLDDISSRYPSTELTSDGPEIGHMTIGAGRVVTSAAGRIAGSIAEGTFFDNPTLQAAMQKAANSRLHLIGLLSDGDVHSSAATLYALLRMAKRTGVTDAFVHAVLDGRDVPQRTADIYVEALEVKMADIGVGKIATLCGRFFAMDTGGNWERTARAFTMLTLADGERFSDAGSAVRASFLRGIADEFISPIVIDESPDTPVATIRDGDVVVFFNHRADGIRQLARSFESRPSIEAICLTEYDRELDLQVAFPEEKIGRSVAAMLEESRVSNYRISDEDRFAHVTEIFNGGLAVEGAHEVRITMPSNGAATRTSEPEGTSFKMTDKAIQAIESDPSGVFIINLPAAALLAETGELERTVEAVQYVDTCLGGLIDKVRDAGGVAMVTSTHANAAAGKAGPVGPTGKVPFHLVDDVSPRPHLRSGGSLQDVGATLLALAGIEIPSEMTGCDLRIP